MNLNELLTSNSPQRAYCKKCDGSLDLVFARFHETVSGVEIDIDGLPMLECPGCKMCFLPDRSRLSLIHAHQTATNEGQFEFRCKRRKIETDFGFTAVPFQYDPDDYHYYPGLTRPWDIGFLTPVFFNRTVLTKYDADPRYFIDYASPTYGDIRYEDEFSFPFGINRHGCLVMWLGDIAKLPKSEQYYLLSENRSSDHSLGSEFYDGQIEAKFTDPTHETLLFAARSNFLAAVFSRWGRKIAHLDTEVRDLAEQLRHPIHDTNTQRHSVSDVLNKIHLESLDNAALAKILADASIDCEGSGSLKRLQALLGSIIEPSKVNDLISPFYTLYDFRVAYSHLGSATRSAARLKAVTDRLAVDDDASLQTIYDRLLAKMTFSYAAFTKAINGEGSDDATALTV